MALKSDIFLKIEGVDGEATDKEHSKHIEIESWSFGGSQESGRSTGTGGGHGKTHLGDLHLTKEMDKSSPILFKLLCDNKNFPTVTMTQRKSGANQKDFLKITLKDAGLTSVQSAGSSGIPKESISFSFAKIDIDYKAQNENGSLEPSVSATLNAKTGASE